jgi:hypothetical protein
MPATDRVCPKSAQETAATIFPDFKIKGLRRRCALKHRNSRRETAGWDRIDHQEVFVLLCDLTAGQSAKVNVRCFPLPDFLSWSGPPRVA